MQVCGFEGGARLGIRAKFLGVAFSRIPWRRILSLSVSLYLFPSGVGMSDRSVFMRGVSDSHTCVGECATLQFGSTPNIFHLLANSLVCQGCTRPQGSSDGARRDLIQRCWAGRGVYWHKMVQLNFCWDESCLVSDPCSIRPLHRSVRGAMECMRFVSARDGMRSGDVCRLSVQLNGVRKLWHTILFRAAFEHKSVCNAFGRRA